MYFIFLLDDFFSFVCFDWHVFVGIIYLGLKLKSFKFNEWRMDRAEEKENFIHKKMSSCTVRIHHHRLANLLWNVHIFALSQRLPDLGEYTHFCPFSFCFNTFNIHSMLLYVFVMLMRKNEFQSAPEFVHNLTSDTNLARTIEQFLNTDDLFPFNVDGKQIRAGDSMVL